MTKEEKEIRNKIIEVRHHLADNIAYIEDVEDNEDLVSSLTFISRYCMGIAASLTKFKGVLGGTYSMIADPDAPKYEGPIIYVVRNKGNHYDLANKSILGLYTNPKELKTGVESIIKHWQEHDNKMLADLEVKIMLVNGKSRYEGCEAYSLNCILNNVETADEVIRQWLYKFA